MHVVVYTLHEKATVEQQWIKTFPPKGTGDPLGEIPDEWHHGDLNRFLDVSKLDVLVLSLPSTEEIR